MTEAEAQAAFAGIALKLVAITDRLQQVNDTLPPSRNGEAMLEHRIAYDVATELAGTIECVVADQLRPAIEYLEAASGVTAEGLREQHREQQALLRRAPRAATGRDRLMTPDPLPEPAPRTIGSSTW